MSAAIPVKGNEAANATAFGKVRADKEREARNGHDGTWVAHPALVPVAMAAFDRPNQLDRVIGGDVDRDDMLRLHNGPHTEAGVRENIRVGVQSLAAWPGGRGAVPPHHPLEAPATAAIRRHTLWQWLKVRRGLPAGLPRSQQAL